MIADTVAMVDWSGGGDTGPRPRKDAIWICVHRGMTADAPVYARNRAIAFELLSRLVADESAAGRRLLIGFDFPFGYPAGFAQRVCGSADPLALWDWFAEALPPTADPASRFDLAGRINARFPGTGPFWFNGLKRDVPDLPRKGTDRAGHGLAERRAAESRAAGAFALWQMGGAGAVGSQAMTGMATLSRLRAAHPGRIAVWPFEPLDRPVSLVEIWPSLIDAAVAETMSAAGEAIRDAGQVRCLAGAVAEAGRSGALDAWLSDVPDGAPRTEEGWILGLGHEAAMAMAARAALHPDLVPPRLSNDCFALPQGVSWTPVDTALETLRARLHRVVGSERVAATAALDRVLAVDAVAVRSNPPAANSAVDGFAFAASSLCGSGRQVLSLAGGRAAAGAPFRGGVPSGSAVRILTGALLPEGVDTVVLEEDCSVTDGAVAFNAPVNPGANTRKAGEDVHAGSVALPAGRMLRPQDLALLSALGISHVNVFNRLRAGVLSTGDEIATPGPVASPPSVTYDANRPMLLALVERWGFAPVDLGHVGDDRQRLRERLDAGAGSADVILTSGGASAGDEDHVSALLRDAGALSTWRIAVKPGRPLALGVWGGVPVFGLPGNPVAAFVCALIFARPAVMQMAGAGWPVPRGQIVPAAFAKRKKPGRREYLRARLTSEGCAEVFKSEGSGRISGLTWAEGLVELPDAGLEISPGDPVTYYPFAAFGL